MQMWKVRCYTRRLHNKLGKRGGDQGAKGIASVQARGGGMGRAGGHCRLPRTFPSSPPPSVESWFLVRTTTWKHAYTHTSLQAAEAT